MQQGARRRRPMWWSGHERMVSAEQVRCQVRNSQSVTHPGPGAAQSRCPRRSLRQYLQVT